MSVLRDKNIAFEAVHSQELNVKKVLMGRITAFPEEFFVGYRLLHNILKPEHVQLFTNHPKPLQTTDAYILVSRRVPDAQDIVNKFDSGLKQLKATGKYDKIFAQLFQLGVGIE